MKLDNNIFDQPIVLEGKITTYQEYIKRIQSEHNGAYTYFISPGVIWKTPKGLIDKIDYTGKIKPYYGNTIVFDLLDREKNDLFSLQRLLRDKMNILASPLSMDKFHLTLHDLFHSKEKMGLEKEIKLTREKIQKSFEKIRYFLKNNPRYRYIELKPGKVVPSVNTSIVIGFLPKSEMDYKILFNLYKIFDEITVLSYFLRPHVTLDYFLPNPINKTQLRDLRSALIEVNKIQLPSLKLDIEKLSYQLFESMNSYLTVEKVGPVY